MAENSQSPGTTSPSRSPDGFGFAPLADVEGTETAVQKTPSAMSVEEGQRLEEELSVRTH